LKLAAKTNIQPSRLSINPLPVYQAVLLAGLALLDPALSIDEVVNQVYIVSKPVVSAGVETQLPMMYKFYTDHAFGPDLELQQWAIPCATKLIGLAKLVHPVEKKFFEDVFRKFPAEKAQQTLTALGKEFERYTNAKDKQLLALLKRAVFMIAIWPDKKPVFLSAIPQGVLDSFPQKIGEWGTLMASLHE
jgi:hypothetical protein